MINLRLTGTDPNRPIYVAIKGIIFDVSRNSAYHVNGSYHGAFSVWVFESVLGKEKLTMHSVFTGKDSSRALALSSLKPEDCRPDWYDLDEKDKGVLEDWFTYFSKRYNIVGKVENATNL